MPRSFPATLLALVLAAALPAAEPAYSDPAITPAQRQHWAYQPPVRPALPAVKNAAWMRTPIDAFVLAKLEANGLSPAPEADRLTWLRRVTFDLTGLPPTPVEQDAFLADRSARAFEKVVERLLASPHYGERWAQHWLDVVRFAETNGYESDSERPHAWRYRDYVVRSFAEDRPYDRFVREQIAGDELAQGKPDREAAEALVATGMHRCGPMHFISGNVDAEAVRQEILTEMVNGVGSTFLGLTVGCARCHDHKFDPISAGDYYRLQAFFAGTQLKDRDLATPEEKAANAQQVAAIQAQAAPLRAKVAALDGPHQAKLGEMKKMALEPKYRDALATPADKRTPEQKKLAEQSGVLVKVTWDEIIADLTPEERAQRKAWRDEIHELEAHLPPPPSAAWAVADDANPPTTYVLKRGEVKGKTLAVMPGFVRVVNQDRGRDRDQGADAPRSPGRLTRADLANWLTEPGHPLTARVWVNRIWQHHFGRGIVGTPNDFGSRGEKPTHPELLDWLATELPRQGWSAKAMHRLMVLSATYRQSSSAESGARSAELNTVPSSEFRVPSSVDPENRLLWRMNRRRLEAETLRDAVLAAAGTLNGQVGGPPVRVPLEPAVYDLIFTEGEPDGLWKPTPDARQHTRRSLYLFAKRNVRLPLMEAFDQPDTLNPCPARPVSTFAPQALILMNGPLAQAQSRALAARLRSELGADAAPAALAERAYRLALGRPPRPEEARLAADYLRGGGSLADFGLIMFNLNEFIYVD